MSRWCTLSVARSYSLTPSLLALFITRVPSLSRSPYHLSLFLSVSLPFSTSPHNSLTLALSVSLCLSFHISRLLLPDKFSWKCYVKWISKTTVKWTLPWSFLVGKDIRTAKKTCFYAFVGTSMMTTILPWIWSQWTEYMTNVKQVCVPVELAIKLVAFVTYIIS